METLEDHIRKKGGPKFRVLADVYRLASNGELRLVDPSPPHSFKEYLFRPPYTLWLWTGLALTWLTIAIIVSTEMLQLEPLKPSRYVLGAIYVLFLPGYSTIEALYPDENSLKPLERLALSIGLSLAIVPLIGLILNYTPWGIRLWSVTLTLAIYVTIILITAAHRKWEIEKLRQTA
ncbi:MAG: DUF1616 domain-containing protein [Sulfolobales archaeon]